MKPLIVDLLRHGEVVGPVSMARGCGTDLALTEFGWQQMRAVAAALTESPLTAIATSPMQRSRLFAEEVAAGRSLPLAILPALREIDFGHWEGCEAHQIADRPLLARFLSDPGEVAIPGGESFAGFAGRVVDGWQTWLEAHAEGHLLLVSHGAVMRVLLSHLLGMPHSHFWRLALPYASWCRVSLMAGEQPRLLFLNREA